MGVRQRRGRAERLVGETHAAQRADGARRGGAGDASLLGDVPPLDRDGVLAEPEKPIVLLTYNRSKRVRGSKYSDMIRIGRASPLSMNSGL